MGLELEFALDWLIKKAVASEAGQGSKTGADACWTADCVIWTRLASGRDKEETGSVDSGVHDRRG